MHFYHRQTDRQKATHKSPPCNLHRWAQKLCLEVQILSFLSHLWLSFSSILHPLGQVCRTLFVIFSWMNLKGLIPLCMVYKLQHFALRDKQINRRDKIRSHRCIQKWPFPSNDHFLSCNRKCHTIFSGKVCFPAIFYFSSQGGSMIWHIYNETDSALWDMIWSHCIYAISHDTGGIRYLSHGDMGSCSIVTKTVLPWDNGIDTYNWHVFQE